MPDQVTTAGPMWSAHLVTTDEQEWENECVLLGLGKDGPIPD